MGLRQAIFAALCLHFEPAALLQVAPSLKCVTATASPAYIHASYPPTFNTRPPVTHHLFGSFLFDGSPSPSPVPTKVPTKVPTRTKGSDGGTPQCRLGGT